MPPGELLPLNLEELLNNMAHVLRSPLHTIGNLAHVVEAGYAGEVNETVRRHMGHIGAANQRLEAALEPLLNVVLAGEITLHPARFDSQEVIGEALKDLKSLEMHFPDTPSTIRVDFAAFQLALRRLVALLSRFAAEEGLSLWASQEECRFMLCFEAGTETPVDTPPLETLPGEWLRDAAGLDLLTVARLIRRLGGTFWASGSSEQPIRFHIALPVEAANC
jgi:signal transduction histidine kinase